MKGTCKIALISLTFLSTSTLSAPTIPIEGSQQAVTITASNGFYYPANRWSWQHMSHLYPTASLDKGAGAVSSLPVSLLNLDNLPVKVSDGQTFPLEQVLAKTFTDAFVVVKDGKIVYEKYFNGQNARSRHQMMSVTKSLSATAIYPLIKQGKINPEKKVTTYIPELAGSAWDDATVDQVLNMTVSLDYTEDYDDPNSGFNQYLQAMNLAGDNRESGGKKGMHTFLQSIKKGPGPHGQILFYATPNTDVLCWIAARVTGQPAYQLIEKNVWSKIGAERDAYILLDQYNTPFCGAGLNATARDLARFGNIMAENGKLNGRQIISPSFIATLQQGGSHQAFNQSHFSRLPFMKNWTYKDQWWISSDHAFAAIGIYGQTIYINPAEKVVIVKQTSRKVAMNSDDNDFFSAVEVIIKWLNQPDPRKMP